MADTEDNLKKQDKRAEQDTAIAKKGLSLTQMSFDLQQESSETSKEILSKAENAEKLAIQQAKNSDGILKAGKESAEIEEEKLNVAKRAFKFTKDSISKGAKLAGLKAKEQFADAKEFIGGVKDKIKNGAKALATGFWVALKTALSIALFGLFVKNIPNIFEAIGLLMQGRFKEAWDLIMPSFDTLWKFIAIALTGLVAGLVVIKVGVAVLMKTLKLKWNIFKFFFGKLGNLFGFMGKDAAKLAKRIPGKTVSKVPFGPLTPAQQAEALFKKPATKIPATKIPKSLKPAVTRNALGQFQSNTKMAKLGRVTAGIGKMFRGLGGWILRLGPMLMTAGSAIMTGLGAIVSAIFSPVGLIIAAVVAVGAALFFAYKHFKKKWKIDSFKDMMKVAFGKLLDLIGTVINAFTAINRWGMRLFAKGLRKLGFDSAADKIEDAEKFITIDTNRGELAKIAGQENTRVSRLKAAKEAELKAISDKQNASNVVIAQNNNSGNITTTNNNTSLVGGAEPASRPTGNPYGELSNLFASASAA